MEPKVLTPNPEKSYSRYLAENLTVAEVAALPDLLGCSKNELTYNLGRPHRISRELIYKMAEVIHGRKEVASELVTNFGLGRERLTIAEAEEMQALTQQTTEQ